MLISQKAFGPEVEEAAAFLTSPWAASFPILRTTRFEDSSKTKSLSRQQGEGTRKRDLGWRSWDDPSVRERLLVLCTGLHGVFLWQLS